MGDPLLSPVILGAGRGGRVGVALASFLFTDMELHVLQPEVPAGWPSLAVTCAPNPWIPGVLASPVLRAGAAGDVAAATGAGRVPNRLARVSSVTWSSRALAPPPAPDICRVSGFLFLSPDKVGGSSPGSMKIVPKKGRKGLVWVQVRKLKGGDTHVQRSHVGCSWGSPAP